MPVQAVHAVQGGYLHIRTGVLCLFTVHDELGEEDLNLDYDKVHTKQTNGLLRPFLCNYPTKRRALLKSLTQGPKLPHPAKTSSGM